MYRHKRVMRVMGEAEQILFDLFARYQQSPGDLPPEWVEGKESETAAERARRIGNFIAGMTDRFALIEHQRLFDLTRICVRRRPIMAEKRTFTASFCRRAGARARDMRLACDRGQLARRDRFLRVVIEPPRDATHGDMATNAAMVLAREAQAKPRDPAEKIAEKLRADALVAAVRCRRTRLHQFDPEDACLGRRAAHGAP